MSSFREKFLAEQQKQKLILKKSELAKDVLESIMNDKTEDEKQEKIIQKKIAPKKKIINQIPTITEEKVREIVQEMIRLSLSQNQPNVGDNSNNLLIRCQGILNQISRWKKFSNGQPLAIEIQSLRKDLKKKLG